MTTIQCRVAICSGPFSAKGFCRAHYGKLRRVGAVCLYCGRSLPEGGQYCNADHALFATKIDRESSLKVLSQEIEALHDQLMLDGSKYTGRVRLLGMILKAAA